MSGLVEQHARKRRMEERAERMHELLAQVSKAQAVAEEFDDRSPIGGELTDDIRALLKEIEGE